MSTPDVRPLPPRPSLEFEHKEAKALLRRLRAGDAEALARAKERHPSLDPAHVQLSDAQLAIAREYGFTSWPRLVRYFGDVERQARGQRGLAGEGWQRDQMPVVRRFLKEHDERRNHIGRALAAFVPRFYGLRLEEVFDQSPLEAELQLAVARIHGFPSWAVLTEESVRQRSTKREWFVQPHALASKAMKALDLAELKRLVATYPDLLHPDKYEASRGGNLMNSAVHAERAAGREAFKPIMDYLVGLGLDLQDELDSQLCGRMRPDVDAIEYLIQRGGNPDAVRPNGVSVLEHALLSFWKGEAVDALAAHAKPNNALWIAAGLGDVDGVRRHLDRDGRPTAEARRSRPPFGLVGPQMVLPHPEPDDEEILMEAFLVAIINQRVKVMEYMLDRGLPIDSLVWGMPVVNLTVGNGWVEATECLIRRGANLDIRGWRPYQSARETAAERATQTHNPELWQRIGELCGLDVDRIRAENAARPREPLGIAEAVRVSLERAGDDAFRAGQSVITPENVFVGLLHTRTSGGLTAQFLVGSGVDAERFQRDFKARVALGDETIERPKLPFDTRTQAYLERATTIATDRRASIVTTLHLLAALAEDELGFAADVLKRYGSSANGLLEQLEPAL